MNKKGYINISYILLLFLIVLLSFSINILLGSMFKKSIINLKNSKNYFNEFAVKNQIKHYIFNNDIIETDNLNINNNKIELIPLNKEDLNGSINDINIDVFNKEYTISSDYEYIIINNKDLDFKDNNNTQYKDKEFFFISNNIEKIYNNLNDNSYIISYKEGQFIIANIYDKNNEINTEYLYYKSFENTYILLEL